MALNGIHCADVPLCSYSLTHLASENDCVKVNTDSSFHVVLRQHTTMETCFFKVC